MNYHDQTLSDVTMDHEHVFNLPFQQIFILAIRIFYIYTLNPLFDLTSVGGIVVSIAAFQAVDPGSIPGHRRRRFFPHFECYKK